MPSNIVELTSEIVTAHLSHNSVEAEQLPNLIKTVYSALSALGNAPAEVADIASAPEAAVTVRKSLSDPTKIISMIDGKGYSTLKKHLTKNGFTPASYRAAFGLKSDYPMVAPAYAEKRRALAKKIGLGQSPKSEEGNQETILDETPASVPDAAPKGAVAERKPRKSGKEAQVSEVPEQQNVSAND